MSSFKVIGGQELSGSIEPQGSKNESLQIVASSIVLLNLKIKNIPKIKDVISMVNILEASGAIVIWEDYIENNIVKHQLSIDTNNINPLYFESFEYFIETQKTRGALMFMGALLARYGKAYIPETGGDKIGARPIDTHTLGFVSLGAVILKDDKGNYLKLDKIIDKTEILLDDASVTGTANVLMCAMRGVSDLVIYNAASETYILQLATILNQGGVNITGAGTNRITINSNNKISTNTIITHTILPDFIEVASFVALAMGTKSCITITNCGIKYLGQTLKMFEKLGCKYEIDGDNIKVLKQESYNIHKMYDGSMMKIYCQPWPNISPDILSVGIVAAIQAKGVVLFNEKMYEARMFFVDKLIAMGAQIVLCDPHRVVVTGLDWHQKLRSRHLTSPDIRAGIALLIAALGAEGESLVDNIEQIDRGYENIDERLASLGAKITRINN